jgi:hypothetical protein
VTTPPVPRRKDEATADRVIETVTDFLRNNPEKLTGLLPDDGPMGKLKGMLG